MTAWGGGENSKPLQGKTVCDFKSVMIDDSTASPEVAFNLDNGKCANPVFGPSVNTVGTDHPSNPSLHYFPPIRLDNCQDVNALTAAADYANCDRGFFSSYEIVVEEFGASSIGSELVGGIAGYSAMAIDGVVVQGFVNGDTYVGGVTGKAVAGQSITNASVTALIHSKKMVDDDTTKLYLGVIVGNASGGSISNTMFLGSIDHECKHGTNPANCAVAKFGGSLVGVTYAASGNYTPSEYTSVNGKAADTGHHGEELAMSAFFDSTHGGGSTFTTYDFATPVWTHTADDIPRLARHSAMDCAQASNLASVPAQIAAGRGGSTSNTIAICNVNQFKTIKNNSDKIYRIEDNFSLWSMAETDVVATLSGQIWGDEHVVFGGYFQPASDTFGLFTSIASTGKVVSLNFAGVQMDTDSRNGIGIVSASNSGLIKEVVLGGLVKGAQAIGGISAYNESVGEIIDVEVFTKVEGTIQVGGIAGINMHDGGSTSAGSIVNSSFDRQASIRIRAT